MINGHGPYLINTPKLNTEMHDLSRRSDLKVPLSCPWKEFSNGVWHMVARELPDHHHMGANGGPWVCNTPILNESPSLLINNYKLKFEFEFKVSIQWTWCVRTWALMGECTWGECTDSIALVSVDHHNMMGTASWRTPLNPTPQRSMFGPPHFMDHGAVVVGRTRKWAHSKVAGLT